MLCLTKSPSQYVVKEMLTLLRWYKVDLEKYQLRANGLRKWEEILRSNVQPPSYQKWSDDDEAKLVDLKRKEIKISDTALGRHRDFQKRELLAGMVKMSEIELEEVKKIEAAKQYQMEKNQAQNQLQPNQQQQQDEAQSGEQDEGGN